MKRISKQDQRDLLCKYLMEKENNMFPFLYEALNWRHNSWQELSPEQVWQEAVTLSDKILRVNVPKFEIPSIIEDLREYTAGEPNAVFLIIFATVYRLTPLTQGDKRIKQNVTFLLKYILQHQLYGVMKGMVSANENDEDLVEYRVNILEYHLSHSQTEHEENKHSDLALADEFVDTALKGDADTMKVTEMVLSRVNDNNNQRYAAQLKRLREKEDSKTDASYQPRQVKAQQIIGTQNNFGSADGLEALPPRNNISIEQR